MGSGVEMTNQNECKSQSTIPGSRSGIPNVNRILITPVKPVRQHNKTSLSSDWGGDSCQAEMGWKHKKRFDPQLVVASTELKPRQEWNAGRLNFEVQNRPRLVVLGRFGWCLSLLRISLGSPGSPQVLRKALSSYTFTMRRIQSFFTCIVRTFSPVHWVFVFWSGVCG